MPQVPSGQDSSASFPRTSGVPLIDIQRQFRMLHEELLAAVGRVCASGRYILGPDCQQLEESLARFCRVGHAIGCASGSDALLLALLACDIGPGDEVLVPSYTFFATASAVARLGAVPVFVDIEPAGFTIDAQAVAAAITPATRAIIPVHLFGQCASMDELTRLAQPHGIRLIEDAAQAIGAELDGRRAGGLGDAACFSFYPTKNLGAFGDAGLLSTDDTALADKLKLLRAHGMQPRYHHQLLGINSRLDTLQAAMLNVKLPHLDHWTELRQQHAERYGELFTAGGLDQVLGLPVTLPGRRHVWNQYVVRVPDGRRDALREHLAARQIGTEIYYPIPLHQQPCFAYLGTPPVLAETELAARETVALPIFPEMTGDEQELVVKAIAEFFGHRATPRRSPLARPKFLDRREERMRKDEWGKP
ncbi:MAG TPA: DegT/DnrJ/EryC1/StrS family aminotransferase [Pirellulales bacterium]|jgi:dTDP-4-amino-4,6-dideoxygalactose transaminase|nr:DegT/DnrJ/EryC1/StrS family aminotransferase [Pirellulales bacterium]